MKTNRRTAERLIRLAYDLEDLAAKMRDDGYDHEAGAVKAASKGCSAAGHAILDKLPRAYPA